MIGEITVFLLSVWQKINLVNIFRSFDCMRIGDQGVKIVKPEDGGDLPLRPTYGNDSIIDSGNDDIEDYDENLIRSVKSN